MAKAAKPFKYRGRWRAQVTLDNGTRPSADFEKYDVAVQWMAEQRANANTEHLPELGGPKQTILAQAMFHYADLHTVTKGGCAAELDRINHYLEGAGLKPLKLVDKDGKRELVERLPKALPSAFAAHKENRLALRAETYKLIASLAQRKCSSLCTADFRRLMVTMEKDGLSGSTIQKEVALLKHMFNVAAKEWNWKGFENPCIGLKLSASEQRFVVITPTQRHALRDALSECDNPYFWPLVEVALQTLLRSSSLLSMSHGNVDLNGRVAKLPSKTGVVSIPLSLKAVELLQGLPHHPSGKYFPISGNAVDMAWDGVRTKIGMPELQFKDLRHIGATDYARAGATVHQLQKLLGHKSSRMAEIYVNLVHSDSLEYLDRIAPTQAVFQIPEPAKETGEEILKRNRARRLTSAFKEAVKATQSKKASGAVDESELKPEKMKALDNQDAAEQEPNASNETDANESASIGSQTDAPALSPANVAPPQPVQGTGTHGLEPLPAQVQDNVIQVDFKRRR